MSPQLQAIADELSGAERRLESMLVGLSADQWDCRPGPGRWSAAECVAHLNLSSEAMLPLLRDAVSSAAPSERRYSRDPLGWLIWQVLAPSGGLKTRTAPAFEPRVLDAPADLVSGFIRLQEELKACVDAAAGRAIDRVYVVSPFDARVRYNLYAALMLVPRHQHRHLRQAEQAAAAAVRSASPAAVLSRA